MNDELKQKIIRNNVTITEARNHCSDPKTSGDGWFDGYEYMKGCYGCPDEKNLHH